MRLNNTMPKIGIAMNSKTMPMMKVIPGTPVAPPRRSRIGIVTSSTPRRFILEYATRPSIPKDVGLRVSNPTPRTNSVNIPAAMTKNTEATIHANESTASEVLAIFLAVCRQDEKTLLLVSHDEAVLGVADRVIDMAELNRTEARRGSA